MALVICVVMVSVMMDDNAVYFRWCLNYTRGYTVCLGWVFNWSSFLSLANMLREDSQLCLLSLQPLNIHTTQSISSQKSIQLASGFIPAPSSCEALSATPLHHRDILCFLTPNIQFLIFLMPFLPLTFPQAFI